MRALGYRTVDTLVDWLSDESQPLLRRATPESVAARLAGPPTDEGEPFEAVLEALFRDVLPYSSRTAHPRYFAFVPSAGTWPGALGDFIASACNVYAGSWMESAGPSQLELEVLDWFKEWVGYPAERRRRARQRRLRREHDRARVRARDARRRDARPTSSSTSPTRRTRRSHGPRASSASVPIRCACCPVGRRRYRLRPTRLRAAIDADDAARAAAALRRRDAGRDEHRRGRPARRARRDLPRARRLVPRRRRLRRLRRAHRARAARARRASSSPTRSRSTRTSGCTSRIECGCLLVRDGRAAAATRSRSRPDYLRDADADAARGELRRPRPAAHAHDARVQALALAAHVRPRRVPRLDRPLPRSRGARRADRIEASEQLELAAPPSLGIVCFRRQSPRRRR